MVSRELQKPIPSKMDCWCCHICTAASISIYLNPWFPFAMIRITQIAQCVLANVRGAGELMFETGFPPSEDVMATLLAEPYGKERFEMEFASR